VLVRVKALVPVLKSTLTRLGLPCSVPEAEAFWVEPRVAAILDAAGHTFGIIPPGAGTVDDATGSAKADARLELPERVLVRGPMALQAYLQGNAPFDRMFWQGPEFLQLKRSFAELGGWQALLNWGHLQSELDMVRDRAEKVQIMTLHAAKGWSSRPCSCPPWKGLLPLRAPASCWGRPKPASTTPSSPRSAACSTWA
jgi:hypothetical protein